MSVYRWIAALSIALIVLAGLCIAPPATQATRHSAPLVEPARPPAHPSDRRIGWASYRVCQSTTMHVWPDGPLKYNRIAYAGGWVTEIRRDGAWSYVYYSVWSGWMRNAAFCLQ